MKVQNLAEQALRNGVEIEVLSFTANTTISKETHNMTVTGLECSKEALHHCRGLFASLGAERFSIKNECPFSFCSRL